MAPRGIGMWLAFNARATTAVENAVIVEQAKRAGLGWLAIKLGDGGRSTRWLSRGPDLVRRLRDAGIGAYTWTYSRPGSWPFEADEIARVLTAGDSDGHIIDAELEWEGVVAGHDTRPSASAFMSRLRAAVGDAFLAHAPIWLPHAHPTFPYREFGERADAVLPQFYWTAAKRTVLDFCTHADAAWAELRAHDPGAAPAVWPIGITYGAGDGWDLWTTEPGAVRLTAEDLDAFLQRYRDVPVSLFSWEAANAAAWGVLNGYADASRLAGEGELERLPDTLPAPPEEREPS